MDPALLRQKEAFKKRAIDATKKSQEIREAASKAKQEVASKLPPKPVKKKKKKSILPRPSGNFTITRRTCEHFQRVHFFNLFPGLS